MAGIMGGLDDFLLGHRVSHALEDLPPGARTQVSKIADLPPGLSLRRKILDELENAGLESYGQLERVRLLRFLSDYPVTAYTYDVSPVMSRGERPTAEKLADLVRQGRYRGTVNLCAEMTDGDSPLIELAGLTGEFATWHFPVVDMYPPAVTQVVALLDLLTGSPGGRTYVHCEAGKGRTGVATACYRMAVMGWSAADALTEAKNFGCSVPRQEAFIGAFGVMLQGRDLAQAGAGSLNELGRYPLQPLGSVRATVEELTATVASCAQAALG
jgi:protein-tyrosine phosphatase